MLCEMFLVFALLPLLTSVNGFVLKDSTSRLAWTLQASDPTSTDTLQDEQRRNFLLTSALAIAGASSSATLLSKGSLLEGMLSLQATGTAANKQVMIDQALEVIENQCDRRFLHAVVSSDYHLLYQMAPVDSQVSVLQTDEDISVLKSSILTSGDLEILDGKLKDRPMHVGASCQLAFANPKDVPSVNPGSKADDDSIVSIWPLGDKVHFTWMEQKTSLASISTDDKIIVDGIDCGRMSLEDALEEGKQVLLQSETYLAVPRSLEKELIAKLRNAFLI